MRWDNLDVLWSKIIKRRATNEARMASIEFTKRIKNCHFHETNCSCFPIDLNDVFRVRWNTANAIFLIEFDNSSDCIFSQWCVTTEILRIGMNIVTISKLNWFPGMTLRWFKPDRKEQKIVKYSILNETDSFYIPSFSFSTTPFFASNSHQPNLLVWTALVK